MIIAVTKETTDKEQRVALTPTTVQKLIANNIKIKIEKGSGTAAGFLDSQYLDAGAKLIETRQETVMDADYLFKIMAPNTLEMKELPKKTTIIADCRDIDINDPLIFKKELTFFALEKIPRISRAQNMDILSSQDNLAGYKAVLESVNILNRVIPMMTTAAGSIPPAKILIIGIGVAGLQAIATAKRLGAVVLAYDIRPETKEQALSLGARFIETTELNKTISEADIVITAAGSPSKAPLLIKENELNLLKHNSVLIDISGNVDKKHNIRSFTTKKGAFVVIDKIMPALLPQTASYLFANNIFSFFQLLTSYNEPDFKDEIINQTCLFYHGEKRS